MSASRFRAWFVVLLVLTGAAWLYWATSESLLQAFCEETSSQLRYPGQLVPFLALFLVWRDRGINRDCPSARYWHAFDTLIDLGLMNQAEKNLTECLETFGEQPLILERLATVNLVKG
ncbi:MAG TPA: hypothetical protein VLI39_18670, partial [Sedimentisphaerales bacterium]|nr:hypothetical protein [Sedimentisphaerales bacterium]